MDLSRSYHLKQLPDLSNATNLEKLELNGCWSLVELPSSIANLHKLKKLVMVCCIRLESVPTNINLASLERVNMDGCSRLRTFPDISTNIRELLIPNTAIEVEPASFGLWSHLSYVNISDGNLKKLSHVSESLAFLDLSYSGIGLVQVYNGNDDGSYKLEPSEVSEDADYSDRDYGLCDSKSEKVSKEEDNVERKEHTNCWSWLSICFDLSHIASIAESLSWGRRRQVFIKVCFHHKYSSRPDDFVAECFGCLFRV